MKILVIGPSWVGDMMMSHSLYRTIQALKPDVTIDVMAPNWCRPLLARMPEVNKAIAMPLAHGVLGLGERRQLGQNLKSENYYQAIVLPNSFKSALIPFFAGIPKRTGWRGEMRYGLINDIRVLDKTAFPLMVERYVALAYDKNIIKSAQDIPQPILTPRLRVTAQEEQLTCQRYEIAQPRPIIGFCPGAEFGPAKRWPHYHYASLASELINLGFQILLLGSNKDHQAGQDILSSLSQQEQQYCLNLSGKTDLDEAVILLSACSAVVSNDSGLMHIAAALNKPLVALYGPTSPDFTPPLNAQAKVIRLISGYHKIRKGDDQAGYHQSLIDIKPDLVLAALKEIKVLP